MLVASRVQDPVGAPRKPAAGELLDLHSCGPQAQELVAAKKSPASSLHAACDVVALNGPLQKQLTVRQGFSAAESLRVGWQGLAA